MRRAQPNPHAISPEPVTHAAVTEIASQLNILKARLGKMHLLKTMHALDDATRMLGWEAAARLEIAGHINAEQVSA